jgi:hypothetical protein
LDPNIVEWFRRFSRFIEEIVLGVLLKSGLMGSALCMERSDSWEIF